MQSPEHPHVHFEHSDVSQRGVIVTVLGVLAGLWISAGLLYFFYAGLAHHRKKVSAPTLPIEAHGYVEPPPPRLQRSPRSDMKEMNRYEDWELSHYHWVDRKNGIVAIPIEKAIDLVASQGIPATNGVANPTNTPPQEGTRETGFEGKVEPEAR